MSWNIKTPGDYINGPLTVAGAVTVTGASNLNGAVNLNLSGSSTVTLGASSSYGVLVGSGTNAASIYINGATRPGFNAVLQFGAAEHQFYNSSLSSLIATLNTTGLYVSTGTTRPLDLTNAAVTTEREIKITNSSVTAYLGVEGTPGRFLGSAANNAYFGTNSAFGLEFATDNNVRMTLNTTGNLAFKNGLGIDFSDASNATGMTSELLNDYEEGTWTGTLTGAVNPAVLITAPGKYTKVGRFVTVQIGFEVVSNVDYSGAISISGLPFSNLSGIRSIGSAGVYLGANFTGTIVSVVNISASNIELMGMNSGNVWTSADHNPGTGRFFWANATYTV